MMLEGIFNLINTSFIMATTYLNFPITLLENFMTQKKSVLDDIMHYSIYRHSLKLEYGTKLEKIDDAADYLGINLGDNLLCLKKGKALHKKNEHNPVMVGISKNMLFDFYENDNKSEFEKLCLLAHLSIRSILSKKPYCKITNKYLFARMDGKAKSCDFNLLSKDIQKYAKEYHAKKIKGALEDNWNLITYGRYTRGFYVSYKLTFEELVFQVEKKRKVYKDKMKKQEKDNTLKLVLEKLGQAV